MCQQNDKRIGINSIILFARVLVLTVINLYSVRVIFRGLGETDFGLYSTLSGFVFISTFIIPVLSMSLQRFYSYSMGCKDFEKLHDIFTASINLTIIICIVLIVIFESIGVWSAMSFLSIPSHRFDAVLVSYQFVLLSLITSLMQIPYTAVIFSHENSFIYASLSCLDCILRLCVAITIGVWGDNLVFYTTGLAFVSLLVLCIYRYYCKSHYSECNYKKLHDKSIYRKIISFSGWSSLGAISGVGIIQGSVILINVFFGPLVNSSFAVANSIYNALCSLSNSIILSFRPQMIKSFASKDNDRLENLYYINNKFIFVMLSCISIPLIIDIRRMLNIWIGTVNENTVIFSRFFILYSIIIALHNPITTIVQATGIVKTYYLLCDCVTLLHLPLSIILLNFGFPSYIILLSMITICLLAHIIRLLYIYKISPCFSGYKYCRKFLLPCINISTGGTIVLFWVHNLLGESILCAICFYILSPIIILSLTYMIGINNKEKKIAKTILFNYIRGKIWHI